MEITEYLKNLDLSEKESRVYLASLELGKSNIVPIATKAQLPRTTTQYILEQLQKIDLLEISLHGARRVYTPYPPKQVLKLLRSKEESLHFQVESLESALPELTRIYASSPFFPKVRFFEGHDIRKIYEEILESPIEETLFIGSMQQASNAVGEQYLKNWMKRRSEKNIKTRAVRTQDGEVQDPIYNAPEGYLRAVRLAPLEFTSPSHVIIYGDNVAAISAGRENFGVVTTSRDFATTMKDCFNQVWKNSEPYISLKREG